MTKYASLDRRVREIEGRHGIDPVILHFANGATRAIHVREPLPLLLATFSLINYFEHDRFEAGPFPDVSTRRLALVRLIGQAVRVETDDILHHRIHPFCVAVCAFENCQTAEEAEQLAEQIRQQSRAHLLSKGERKGSEATE